MERKGNFANVTKQKEDTQNSRERNIILDLTQCLGPPEIK